MTNEPPISTVAAATHFKTTTTTTTAGKDVYYSIITLPTLISTCLMVSA